MKLSLHISREQQSGQLAFGERPGALYFRLDPGPVPAQLSTMRKTALIGFGIGMTLGCLFGAVMTFLPRRDESKPRSSMSVNEVSGKPQLHVRGKPEIK